MGKVLTARFFERDAPIVAESLLGMVLVRSYRGKQERCRIIETEAYDGPQDLACHAAKGRTKRTEVLYGPAGHWYVYLCYGMHWMLNVVTGPVDHPAAVLLRAVESHVGPGRLTKALHITKSLNTKPATIETGLWIERGVRPTGTFVQRTPRIGIPYAQEWASKPWRFVVKQ
jgi:DNA-3-methyladenine glycosylase